ncbi:hypothetical protein LTR95_005385 [Oleoguttula sp. CCFEE 5521]
MGGELPLMAGNGPALVVGDDGKKYCSSCDFEATHFCVRCHVAKFCGYGCENGEDEREEHEEICRAPTAFRENQEKCGNCRKTGKFACVVCNGIQYCSERCADQDRPLHALICTTAKDFLERPSPDHRLGLYFPESEFKPQFIWLPTRDALPEVVCEDEGESLDAMKPCEKFIAALIAQDGSPIAYNGIDHLGDIAYELEHESLGCYSRESFTAEPVSKSKVNRAVVTATAPQEDIPIRQENFGAKGGFVWFVGDKEGDTQDVLMIDLRRTVDYYSRVFSIWEACLRDKVDSPWSSCN